TPNIPEAEALTGIGIRSENDMCTAARKLRELGARAVLIKGGHLTQRSVVGGQKEEGRREKAEKAGAKLQAIDVLDDGGTITVFRGEWIDSPPVRGTGCMLSAAIAACWGLGMELKGSVSAAKRFVTEAIR